MFDYLNDLELEDPEYAREKEQERQAEETRTNCLKPAPKGPRVGLGTASQVGLAKLYIDLTSFCKAERP
jgi:hypothetical protein